MNDKSANEQINITETITIQILKEISKEMKISDKRNKYSQLAKKYRRKFTKALRRMRIMRRQPGND